MSIPVISIITPAYNAGQYLAATLEASVTQSWRQWEHIVVDDGSTDDTKAVVEQFRQRDARIRLVSQPNAGMSAARNLGFEVAADSDYVIFLDADDVWRPHALESLLDALTEDPTVPAAHGLSARIGANGELVAELSYEQEGRLSVRGSCFSAWPPRVLPLGQDEPTSLAAMAYRNPITTAGQVLIRRSALDRAGLFDEHEVAGAEDWDLWLRLVRLGPFAYVPEVVIDYRRHDTNSSLDLSRMRRGMRRVRSRAINDRSATLQDRRVARLGKRRFEADRFLDRLRLARYAIGERAWRRGGMEGVRALVALAQWAESFLPLRS